MQAKELGINIHGQTRMMKEAKCQMLERKYVDLEKSCLSDTEREELMNMLCMDEFSLRGGISKCPNKEVEMDVTDTSPFLVRPYHVKEEHKAVLDNERKRLCS